MNLQTDLKMLGCLEGTLSRCTSPLNAARARSVWRSWLPTCVSVVPNAHKCRRETRGDARQTCDAEDCDRVTSPQTLLTHQMMRSMTFAVFAIGMCLQAVGAEEGGRLQPRTKGARRHVFKVKFFRKI